jgi:hypothetical protein
MTRTLTAWCTFVLLVLSTGSALAHASTPRSFKATDYPIEVRKVLSSAVLSCRQAGGARPEFGADTVRRIDFNGDGRIDYVVNFGKVVCPEREHIFCGTGGCETHFMVRQPNGRIRTLFVDTIHSYRMLPRKGPGWVRFSVHHSYCDAYLATTCFKDRRIGYMPFTPK